MFSPVIAYGVKMTTTRASDHQYDIVAKGQCQNIQMYLKSVLWVVLQYLRKVFIFSIMIAYGM